MSGRNARPPGPDDDATGRAAWDDRRGGGSEIHGTDGARPEDTPGARGAVSALADDHAGGMRGFVEGTLILTPAGEVPVEHLRAGDQVVTPRAASPLARLVWVGRIAMDLAHQRLREMAAPVLVKAGALAEGVPFRDLQVGPNHALFVDGQLVPARLLVNGLTVIHQRWRMEVTYHRLDLDRHDLLVSDGALTGSTLDDGNRALFDAPGGVPVGADLAARPAMGRHAAACAPALAEGDALLHAIRMRLGTRAGHLQARRPSV
jgi:hypothetical protein